MVPQKELSCLKKRGQLNIRKRRAFFCSDNLEPPPPLLLWQTYKGIKKVGGDLESERQPSKKFAEK